MSEDTDESANVEIPMHEILARTRIEQLPTPTPGISSLPFQQLSPPIFERLIAETVWLVDGLNSIRIYGRSGQNQGGLDLIGRRGSDLHLYQVRRIEKLTPSALRIAVQDYADPKIKVSGNGAKNSELPKRRFGAKRFVLVTACTVDDTAVEDELVALQDAYAGDLQIDLYDGQALEIMLRDRGSLIYGIFGPEWARLVAGHESLPRSTTPDGRLLLNDPVEMLGFSELRSEAESLDARNPIAAARKFSQLSHELTVKGFAVYGRHWKARARDAKRAGGDTSGALRIALELLLELYEAGQHIGSEANHVHALSDLIGGVEVHAATVATALSDWPERGYDLDPISAALDNLASGSHEFAGRLTTSIAEQIVTDDHPDDNFDLLLRVASRVLDELPPDLKTRLECCIADLNVHAGMEASDAFKDLIKRAHGGRFSESVGALVLRRAGRALAYAGAPEDAIEIYRRAVIDSANADHGGDTRDSLRSIAYLTDSIDLRHDPMRSAKAISTRARFLPGSENAALGTLDMLVDNKLPEARRLARHWVRYERVSGALLDEMIARKRYGDVFARGQMPEYAVRQFVIAGARKEATEAAQSAPVRLNMARYLVSRFPPWVHASAAAVCREQVDLLPDEAVEEFASALSDAFQRYYSLRNSSDPDKYALGALGALHHRLPITAARRLLPTILTMVPRSDGKYRFTDHEMLSFLLACTTLQDDELAIQAARALVDCLRYNIDRADRYLFDVTAHRDDIVSDVKSLAHDGNTVAIHVLASWEVASDDLIEEGMRAANRILEHPVGQPRNSWGVGRGASYGSLVFRVAYLAQSAESRVEWDQLRDRVIEHLVAWGEDSYDLAGSRLDALSALAGLSDIASPMKRAEIVQRLVSIHDDPRLNAVDISKQESLHPFSRFRLDTGSEHLAAESLLMASYYIESRAEAEAIYDRIKPVLMTALPNRYDASLRSKTIVQINRMLPLDLEILAVHPAPSIRQASAVCWANQSSPDWQLVKVFAADSNRVVRANLADTLAHLARDSKLETDAQAVLDALRKDEDVVVRQRANI